MKLKYFTAFSIILIIEICISFTKGFIRYTLGDYFAVILLYLFIKSFTNFSVNKVALAVLLISYFIEFLQLTNLKNFYPNEYLKTFQLTLGTTFSIEDLIAYTFGVFTVFLVEKYLRENKKVEKN
ncbi:MAG: DUF2809 domain-containing protein [Polaribacter sp.]|nr:DUF2809 domain-containing protein [Polaribacter sp.]